MPKIWRSPRRWTFFTILNMQVYLTWIALYKWQHWDVAVNFIAIWHSCELRIRVFRPFRGCIFQPRYLFNQPSKSHDFICAGIVSLTLFRSILFIGWKLVFRVLSVGSAIQVSTTVYLLSTKYLQHHPRISFHPLISESVISRSVTSVQQCRLIQFKVSLPLAQYERGFLRT